MKKRAMKKIVRLTENELTNIIKRIIFEENLTVDPYTLSATSDGNIKITNKTTKKSWTYGLSAYVSVLGIKSWVSLSVQDFPGGTKMKFKAVGQEQPTEEIDFDRLKKILTVDNLGKTTIYSQTKKGTKLKYTKTS